MDALFRRRQMMLGGDRPTPIVSDYVQDGLVLHMDAKSPGETAGAWTSLVGNHVFTNFGAIFNENHVLFDGIDDYLVNTSFSPPAVGTGTIEIVLDCDDWGTKSCVAFAGKTNGGFCFYFSSAGNIYWSIGTTAKPVLASSAGLSSFSICDSGKYQNGSVLSPTSATNYLGGRDSNNYIGKRSSGNPYKGKIFAIRIYNRKLTEAEVMQNLAVDNTRYQLGLTL